MMVYRSVLGQACWLAWTQAAAERQSAVKEDTKAHTSLEGCEHTGLHGTVRLSGASSIALSAPECVCT